MNTRKIICSMITLAGLVLVASLALPPQLTSASTTWYVAPGGDDNYDCQSQGTPCLSIQSALDKPGFLDGDTVLVATGIYTGTGSQVLLIDKSANLSGGWDVNFVDQTGASTIDGEQTRRGIEVSQGVTSTIELFVVQNGGAPPGDWGAGILTRGTLTLNKVHTRNNGNQTGGGGIYNIQGTLTLNDSAVTGNNSTEKCMGGIFNSSGTLTLNNSTVSHNESNDKYCAPLGGVTTHSGPLYLNNSTVSHNIGGGLNSWPADMTTLQNSIIANNVSGNGSPADCLSSDSILSLGYNIVGVADCTISSAAGDQIGTPAAPIDPGLAPLTGSPAYHPLLFDSPAVDAGNPSGCEDHTGTPLPFDQRGAARVGTCDIGAYEYTVPGPPGSITAVGGTPQRTPPFSTFATPFQAVVFDNIGTPVSDAIVTFSAPLTGPSGTFSDGGTYTTTMTTDSNGIVTATPFTANGLGGGYVVTATVSGIVTPTHFSLSHFGWYVAVDGDDSDDCQNPGTACETVAGVLAKLGFLPGDTALFAAGLYTSADPQAEQVVLLDNDIRIVGGWTDGFTTQNGTSTLDGQGARKGLRVGDGVTAIVERFTIQNGYAKTGGGVTLVGGGIYNGGELTLNGSLVKDSTANYGGGIANAGGISSARGTMILNNSIVRNNTANDGGGIFNEDNLTLNNTTVRDNTTTSSGNGGGIYNSGSSSGSRPPVTLVLNNSTVSGNTANQGGGIFNGGTLSVNSSTISNNSNSGLYTGWSSTSSMQNTILAGNSGSSGPDCSGSGTIDSLGYNLIGDTSGCTISSNTGDLLDVDPRLFVLSGSPPCHPLFPGSPAIDAGNPGGCEDHKGNLLPFDQRGIGRVGRCDIGSYEYDPLYYTITSLFLPAITRNYCADFFDDFSNPNSGWPVFDDSDLRAEYLNGEYRLLTKNDEYIYLWGAPTCNRQNYVLEVDARWVGSTGESYGLIFGMTGVTPAQMYIFEVRADVQKFSLYRFDGSGEIVPPTKSLAIKGNFNTNHLKVTRSGLQITLEINGTVLGTWQDSDFIGSTGVGFYTLPYDGYPTSDVRFDNFSVKSLSAGSSPSLGEEISTSRESEAGLSSGDHFSLMAPAWSRRRIR